MKGLFRLIRVGRNSQRRRLHGGRRIIPLTYGGMYPRIVSHCTRDAPRSRSRELSSSGAHATTSSDAHATTCVGFLTADWPPGAPVRIRAHSTRIRRWLRQAECASQLSAGHVCRRPFGCSDAAPLPRCTLTFTWWSASALCRHARLRLRHFDGCRGIAPASKTGVVYQGRPFFQGSSSF